MAFFTGFISPIGQIYFIIYIVLCGAKTLSLKCVICDFIRLSLFQNCVSRPRFFFSSYCNGEFTSCLHIGRTTYKLWDQVQPAVEISVISNLVSAFFFSHSIVLVSLLAIFTWEDHLQVVEPGATSC